jgi:protease-4
LSLSKSSHSNNYNNEELLFSGSSVAAAINDAAKQSDIEAIVIRVNSPGGTPAASEVIRHAIVKAQKDHGKKVYISMAGVAASGGYWLSANADKIFALPSTLTGSIGVVGGKVTLQGLAKKLDINIEAVRYGENAGFWSMTEPFNEDQAKSFGVMLDATYDSFITRVAEGRGMTLEEAEKVAKGRVWTGTQALERGLIDDLAGLGGTLDALAKDLGFKSQADLALVQFPREKPTYVKILEFLEKQAVFMGTMDRLQAMMENMSIYFEPYGGVLRSDVKINL